MYTEYEGKKVWGPDDFDYANVAISDFVDAEVVMNAMNLLSPTIMYQSYAQVGGSYSDRWDPLVHRDRPTYATYRCIRGNISEGIWMYCGNCFRGETTERGNLSPYVQR